MVEGALDQDAEDLKSGPTSHNKIRTPKSSHTALPGIKSESRMSRENWAQTLVLPLIHLLHGP